MGPGWILMFGICGLSRLVLVAGQRVCLKELKIKIKIKIKIKTKIKIKIKIYINKNK
jgi:hypothetical protein